MCSWSENNLNFQNFSDKILNFKWSLGSTGHTWHKLAVMQFTTYFSRRVGSTRSGFIIAKCCKELAASKLPNLLNTANMTGGFRLSTNWQMSSSVSFFSGGIGVSHVCLLNFSLIKTWEYVITHKVLHLDPGQMLNLTCTWTKCTADWSNYHTYGTL